ncbi:hypothetical protein [Nocardia wallacei]|uniref:hypothetical protein n=1 Tax=Nocardia wallacei TaxID=480035 RepID=UPI002454F520|nr:hypothetical protein [Nocardia wallacei]
MKLTELEVAFAHRLLYRDLQQRQRAHAGIPLELKYFLGRLDHAMRHPEEDDDGPDIESEEIGTREAAGILGCSTRQVRYLAADLDGIRIGRDWIFSRRTVEEYADAHGPFRTRK